MKRWAIVIFKANGFLDYVSVYGKNKREAKKNANATIADHFQGAKIIKIMPYNEYWGLKDK